MKKCIFIILVGFLLVSCQSTPKEDFLSIVVDSPYDNWRSNNWNGRNGKDYIKLWLNDSLIFSGLYFTEYNDTLPGVLVHPKDLKDILGMTIAVLNKKELNYKDSLKARLRFVSLDGLPNERPVFIDSTFIFYPIDSISSLLFLVHPDEEEFRGYDYYHDPKRWEVD